MPATSDKDVATPDVRYLTAESKGLVDRIRKPTNSSRGHLFDFVRGAGRELPDDALVLDAGAGNSIYRDLLPHVQYEAADFQELDKNYGELTYVCDLRSIPVEDDRFDAVIFTQVLEHLPEPAAVLAELHRVLRPGGRIWASTPFFYEPHEEPFDFFRYTEHGLRHLFEAAGFTDVQVEWLEGYLATVGYQLQVASGALPRAAAPLKALLRLGADLAARSDQRRKVTDRGFPKNWTVVATA